MLQNDWWSFGLYMTALPVHRHYGAAAELSHDACVAILNSGKDTRISGLLSV